MSHFSNHLKSSVESPEHPIWMQDEELPVARRAAAPARAARAPRRAAAAPAKYVDLSSDSDGVVNLDDASQDSDFELSD